ncbi:hypothetical protein [Acinetobacter pittii]|uniref:hypothetical protein n=1 Tax=Acinetobacter pittii TaxID=48296 RepID=UPI000A3564BC|nr:hypothetical protein [Acinetobacter pittii]OTM62944.1 hypothetical protein B9X37_04825 [Acinetobacter pittii]
MLLLLKKASSEARSIAAFAFAFQKDTSEARSIAAFAFAFQKDTSEASAIAFAFAFDSPFILLKSF